jgi:two-component system response regulator DevR
VLPYGSKSLRVFLLDDHDIVRRGVRDLLSPARDITIAGESSYARNAIDLIPGLEIDVMVLDVHLQDGTGIEVCRAVRAVDPDVRGLLLTASGDDEATIAAILAGASGFTTKLAQSADLIGTVRAVGSGKQLVDPVVTAAFVADLEHVTPRLSKHEVDLLTKVAEGMTDSEIAASLGAGLPAVTAEVATLIDRMTGVRPGTDPARAGRSEGRHRRHDH